MGRGYVQYRWPDSRREEWVLWSAYVDYRLADGSQLHVMQEAAWCANCDCFVIAEDIPTISTLEEELARYRSGDPETLQAWAFCSNGRPIARRINQLLRYIAWRATRTSPPRCLHCGAAAIIPIPQSGTFTHPGTGECVIVESSGFADTAPWYALFSPEGELLADPYVEPGDVESVYGE